MIFFALFAFFTFLIFYTFFNKKKECNCNEQIKTILRGSARYSLASIQDKSPLIALLHINYGLGYFWALKDAFTDQEIYNSTNLDILEYQTKITNLQDIITKSIIKLCPNFANELDVNLARIAGEY